MLDGSDWVNLQQDFFWGNVPEKFRSTVSGFIAPKEMNYPSIRITFGNLVKLIAGDGRHTRPSGSVYRIQFRNDDLDKENMGLQKVIFALDDGNKFNEETDEFLPNPEFRTTE